MSEPSFLRDTRVSYDTIAADYAAKFGQSHSHPIDLAFYAAFAELANTAALGPVADLGCGPGIHTAGFASHGLDIFGIDLSPGMVAQARESYPHLRFEVGSMLALDLPAQSLGGVTALYSMPSIPTELLPSLFNELYRVLVPGGLILLAFQIGDNEQRTRTEAFGRPVMLEYYLHHPDYVLDLMTRAGFTHEARLIREADESREERAPRACLIARAS